MTQRRSLRPQPRRPDPCAENYPLDAKMRRAAARLLHVAENHWGAQACGTVCAEDALLLLLRMGERDREIARCLRVDVDTVRRWKRRYRDWRRLRRSRASSTRVS